MCSTWGVFTSDFESDERLEFDLQGSLWPFWLMSCSAFPGTPSLGMTHILWRHVMKWYAASERTGDKRCIQDVAAFCVISILSISDSCNHPFQYRSFDLTWPVYTNPYSTTWLAGLFPLPPLLPSADHSQFDLLFLELRSIHFVVYLLCPSFRNLMYFISSKTRYVSLTTNCHHFYVFWG